MVSSASAFMRGSTVAYSSRLASGFSMIASITRSACATPSPARSPFRRAATVGALGFVLHLLGEQLLRAGQRAIDEALLAVLQRHLEALVGRPRRDVAAHHAGADDVHVLDAVILAAQALQAFLQEEHADQVARGRRGGQLDHRLALGRQPRLDAAAAALPGVDQRVRRGVVLLARLARDLLGQHRREQLARRPGVGGPGQ